MWAAEIVHYPNPRPNVLRTTDIKVESILGSLTDLMNYFNQHQDTISRATMYPPGKWHGLTEFETYPDETPPKVL